jgi:hypothetical protein
VNETVTTYRMNPAEDRIVFGEEITEGMWVLTEPWPMRSPHGSDEESHLRAQRFRKVTRLRHVPGSGASPAKVVFVGEWVDGYQEVHEYAVTYGWLVKKDPVTAGEENYGSESEER